jgi:hypothetical protein
MPKNRRNKTRNGQGVVTGTGANAATMSIRGSARADQKFALPLLGDKFENKRMLYYDNGFSLAGTSGILQTHYFRCNDVYDPDATGGGHQPIGFDQAMLFWEQFCVFSSKITVTFMNNSNNTTRVGIFLNPDQTNPSSIDDLMENGYLVTGLVSGSSTYGGKGVTTTLTLTFDAPRYFSSKSREEYFANPNFTGTSAASPAEMAYFGVFGWDFGVTTTYQTYYDVTLSYDVRFWEPRKIDSSFLHGLSLNLEEMKKATDDSARKEGILAIPVKQPKVVPARRG